VARAALQPTSWRAMSAASSSKRPRPPPRPVPPRLVRPHLEPLRLVRARLVPARLTLLRVALPADSLALDHWVSRAVLA